ncbi:hypothetical protein HN51_003914 [Arachis hypogaea]
MTTSRRVADRKVARFERNIAKRCSENKKGIFPYPICHILIGFLLSILIGSSLFVIIRTASSRGL